MRLIFNIKTLFVIKALQIVELCFVCVLQKKQKPNCLSQYILFQNECILQQTDPTPRRYANSGEVQVNENVIADVKMLTERIALS